MSSIFSFAGSMVRGIAEKIMDETKELKELKEKVQHMEISELYRRGASESDIILKTAYSKELINRGEDKNEVAVRLGFVKNS